MTKKRTKLVFVGEVDHGKSTIIGRLLADFKLIHEDKIKRVQEVCKKQGRVFEYAFLLDALEEEQKQGITIDITRIDFSTKKRDFTIIDAPGHKEFLKNMLSGASKADVGIIIIDAAEGIKEQSKRHGYILSLMGIKKVMVLVNKMDLVDYKKERFLSLKNEYLKFLKVLKLEPEFVIPISGMMGDNIANKSSKMAFYNGPIFVEAIDKLPESKEDEKLPLRFPIQDTYRFKDNRRIIAGRIESGQIKVGDEIYFSPTNKKSKVASIEKWNAGNVKMAKVGESIGITIKDELFAERGQIICPPDSKPMHGNIFSATVFWIAKSTLKVGQKYTLRISTNEVQAKIYLINKIFDSSTLAPLKGKNEVNQNEVSELILQTESEIAFDNFSEFQTTGRFVLIENHDVQGGGIIVQNKDLKNRLVKAKSQGLISPTKSLVSKADRIKKNKHRAKVIWLTGIPGSGRNSIAKGLEKSFFDEGYNVYLLSAANLRLGLSSDLNYSAKSRHEQARRIAEMARIFIDAGMVLIVSSVSPYIKDREFAKKLIGEENFVEVFVDCDPKICRQRNPHGLIENTSHISGFDAPYEKSENPDVYIDNSTAILSKSVSSAYNKIKKFLND